MNDTVEPLRWGILSTARIGLEKVIPALQAGENCLVRAIASRNLVAAQAAAVRLGIERAHGSYEALLADDSVEAVYVPLPNHLHVDWSIRALEAGKHVLCEKPLGLDADDAGRLLAAARSHPDLKVMEAFMYRFHPQWQFARALVAQGALGRLCAIESHFSYFNDDAGNIRNQPALGGGALMDIGCYNLSLSRFLFDAEPIRVMGWQERDPVLGVDRLSGGMLEFPGGLSTFTCGTQQAPYQRVNVFGTGGRLDIEIPFNAPPDRSTRVWLHQGDDSKSRCFDACDQYTLQGEAFASAVRNDAPVPTPLADALDNMRVLDAVVLSAAKGRWVEMRTDG